MNTLAETIKHYRENANLSKSELARRLHVSPAYITMLEKGEKTNPSGNVIFSLSDILNIPYSELPILEYQQDKNLADDIEERVTKIKNQINNISDEELLFYKVVDLLEQNNYELSYNKNNEIEIYNLNDNTRKVLSKDDFMKYGKSLLDELEEMTKFQIKQWLKRN